MTVKEIHNFIWDSVIKACEGQSVNPDPFKENFSVKRAKKNAVESLYNQHKITDNAREYLRRDCDCVLCAINSTCATCNLYLQSVQCSHPNSLYLRATELLDIKAMESIRDVDVTNESSLERSIGILEEEPSKGS